MVYKSLHGVCSRETAYNGEDSQNKLNVPLPRTNYYKNSFTCSYSGTIHLWNSLPCDVREAESLGNLTNDSSHDAMGSLQCTLPRIYASSNYYASFVLCKCPVYFNNKVITTWPHLKLTKKPFLETQGVRD